MSFSAHTNQVSESSKAMEAELKRRKRMWYALNPASIVVAGIFLLCMFIVPVARGRDMSEVVINDVGMAFLVSLLLALLFGWMGWLMLGRRDAMANIIFCLVLIGCGIWTTGLSPQQRTVAQTKFHNTVGRKMVAVTDKALDLIHVDE